MSEVQGYLAGKKTQPPGTLLWAYAKGPRGVLEGWTFSVFYGRGTPVPPLGLAVSL